MAIMTIINATLAGADKRGSHAQPNVPVRAAHPEVKSSCIIGQNLRGGNF
jgi:hypothetical protein